MSAEPEGGLSPCCCWAVAALRPQVAILVQLFPSLEAYVQSLNDPETYWGAAARELVWTKKWTQVLDRARPGFREAVAAARSGGWEAILRLAGGRAAVFHRETIAFAWCMVLFAMMPLWHFKGGQNPSGERTRVDPAEFAHRTLRFVEEYKVGEENGIPIAPCVLDSVVEEIGRAHV